MKKIILISLLTSTLFADQKDVVSDFNFTQDVKEMANKSGYGKTDTYSLLFARHDLTMDDENLHFYYGAKLGFVSEEYANNNGFGIPLNEIGAYYAAAIGMEYKMDKNAVLLAEGTHAEDQVHQRAESKAKLTYTYTY